MEGFLVKKIITLFLTSQILFACASWDELVAEMKAVQIQQSLTNEQINWIEKNGIAYPTNESELLAIDNKMNNHLRVEARKNAAIEARKNEERLIAQKEEQRKRKLLADQKNLEQKAKEAERAKQNWDSFKADLATKNHATIYGDTFNITIKENVGQLGEQYPSCLNVLRIDHEKILRAIATKAGDIDGYNANSRKIDRYIHNQSNYSLKRMYQSQPYLAQLCNLGAAQKGY